MTFINQYSFKCLLGPQSKNVQENNNLYSWQVGKKNHFTTDRFLTTDDLPRLNELAKTTSSFHYLSEVNLLFLKQHFQVDRSKLVSVIIDLEKFNLVGNDSKNLRHCFNKCNNAKLQILDNFKDIKDVEKMISIWSDEISIKYFRNFSGKNVYFYKNNFHSKCINVFIYDDTELVSFGTLSPETNSSYIIGKALYKKYYGLSEYTDIVLYKKAIELGVKSVNLGQAKKGLHFYKTKFPNSSEEIHYDGKIEIR